MKKAFTLVEMLIVVVVLVTLMTIAFRMGAVGNDTRARNATVARLQRVENALSGYYAAFGTYPPVKLHGERNPFLRVDGHGIQNRDGDENTSIWGWVDSDGMSVRNAQDEHEAWRQVQAACRSQPVDCQYPFPKDMQDLVAAATEELQLWAQQSESMSEKMKTICSTPFDDGVSQNIGRHSKNRGKTDWRDVQLFKFGLLSYLLPRYLLMMNGDEQFFESYEQWLGNNIRPSDPMTGVKFSSWGVIQNYALSDKSTDLAHVANIPSQAVCARWMANFEGLLCCNYDVTVFGVNLRGDGIGQENGSLPRWNEGSKALTGQIYSPEGEDSTSNQYVLDQVTVRDGWGHDIYYYSPAPHQSYVLWSPGPNGRTFPPWIARDALGADANRCIAYWVRDDITSLSK